MSTVISLKDLQANAEALEKKCRLVSMENEMLEDYLKRNNVFGDFDEADTAEATNAASKKRGKAASKKTPQNLTMEDLYLVATSEVDALFKEIEQSKKKTESNVDLLRAIMEEFDIRVAEVKREAYEFRRDIVVGAENARTGHTNAEKVLKYMEDKLTQKDMLINKLLMKNQSYKASIKKAQKALSSKADHDDLQYIDFHQLQIENQQFVVKIENANQELVQLKQNSGRTLKMLNSMKQKLSVLEAHSKNLQQDIQEHQEQMRKTKKEHDKVQRELRIAQKENTRGRGGSESTPIMDYVYQKAEEGELNMQIKNWERKIEIATLEKKKIDAARMQHESVGAF